MVVRTLPIAVGLAVIDYLGWNWATVDGRTVPAIITGLAMPPLAIAVAWIALLTVLAGLRRLGGGVRRAARPHTARPASPGSLPDPARGEAPQGRIAA